MKQRPYYYRSDRDLAGMLLDLMEAQGMTEPPSIARAIEMIRLALVEQHGDSVPSLGTGRGIRVVDAWLAVVRAERAVAAARQSGDTDALTTAREAEVAALHRASTKTADQLQAERDRSAARRRLAQRNPKMEVVIQSGLRMLLMAAVEEARETSRRAGDIANELAANFERIHDLTPGKPGRKPSPKPVDQLPSTQALPVDQSAPSLPVDQLTIHNDPRQVSLLGDQ